MIKLRENQTEPIRKAVEFFRQDSKDVKPSLIVLPTAWGKSLLTAYVAQGTEDNIIVLQPSKELLKQNFEKYQILCGGMAMDSAIYSASLNSKSVARVTYATIGSIKSIGKEFKELGFTKMIIDEAHLYPRNSDSMLGHFLEDSGIRHVLGITATPLKLQSGYDRNSRPISKLVMLTSRSKHGNFFKEILHVGQVSEMVKLKYWSPLVYEDCAFDDSLLVYNSTGSEYTEWSVKRAFEANDVLGRMSEALDLHSDRRHVLAFVPSVAEAKLMADKYPDSAYVCGDMDKSERDRVINEFRAGHIRVLFNVRVLSTGFDYTGIDCIMLGISTASIALYYQIIGRATRIDTGKQDALIVDFGGNVRRFGRVEDIVFEKGKIWRMFGTDGRLLSGIPIEDIGTVHREDVVKMETEMFKPIEVMPFGKYKDERISDVPLAYRQWMIHNFTWDKRNERLKAAILNSFNKI